MDVDDDLVRALEVDVEQRQSIGALEAGEAGLDDQRLAEDAGRLGERHRQALLQRRAIDERRVVIGVAEFVGRGLRRFRRTRPVQQDERTVADERHAEGAARFALGGRRVDPLLVEGAVDEVAQRGAELAERGADDVDALVPRHVGGGHRQRRDQVPPGQPGSVRSGSGPE